MFLNGEQADGLRAKAVKLVTGVLDFNRGDMVYKDVCKGYAQGLGTSCSFLPHWMLLRLGVSTKNTSKTTKSQVRGLINRDDAVRGTTLAAGEGISLIANSPAFVRMQAKGGGYPRSGDIVVIQSDPYMQTREHVFVFLGRISDTLWDTGESGQASSNASAGAVEGKRKKRAMRISDRKMIAVASDGIPDRYVQGWLDISKLDYVDGSVP
jgi:hypothetical protein